METNNLWSEESDFNIVASWLVGTTDGATWSICNRFLPRIKGHEYQFEDIEEVWDNAIGPCLYLKLDDPSLTSVTWEIVGRLNSLIDDINNNPDKYFKKKDENKTENCCMNCAHRFACETNKPDFRKNGCCAAYDFLEV